MRHSGPGDRRRFVAPSNGVSFLGVATNCSTEYPRPLGIHHRLGGTLHGNAERGIRIPGTPWDEWANLRGSITPGAGPCGLIAAWLD